MNVINAFNHQPKSEHKPSPLAFKKPWYRRTKVPIVAQISGLFSLLLLGAGLLTVVQLNQSAQDLQSQAAAGKVRLFWQDENWVQVNVGQTKDFLLMAETDPVDLKVSAAKLIFCNPNPEFLELVEVSPAPGLHPLSVKLEGLKPERETCVQIVMGAQPGQELRGKEAIAKVSLKVIKRETFGQTRFQVMTRSEIAAFGSNTNVLDMVTDPTAAKRILYISTPKEATPPTETVCWNYVVLDNGVPKWPNGCKGKPKSAELACIAEIKELTAEEKTAYQAWKNAGSVIPTVCGESTSTTDPKLSLKFRIQGVIKAGITKNADVTIRYHQKNSAEMFSKTFQQTFTSQADGTFATSEPIVLTEIHPELIDQVNNKGIDILVKTPTTLRKKLGTIAYPPADGSNNLIGNFNTQDLKLIVGDFDRSHQPHEQENVLRGSDIGKLVSQFSAISHPVTAENIDYDVDNNGTLNGADIGLIISNLTAISITGDPI